MHRRTHPTYHKHHTHTEVAHTPQTPHTHAQAHTLHIPQTPHTQASIQYIVSLLTLLSVAQTAPASLPNCMLMCQSHGHLLCCACVHVCVCVCTQAEVESREQEVEALQGKVAELRELSGSQESPAEIQVWMTTTHTHTHTYSPNIRER